MPPAIDPVFGRARIKTKGKSKRRVMRSFKLDEISVVDNPAQAGATVKIMKRRTPLHQMNIDYDRAMSDAAHYRKHGQHQLADELEQALTLHANVAIRKTGASVMDLFSKAGASAGAAGSFGYEMDKADEDGIEEMLAELQRQLPNEDPAELRAMLVETLGKEGEGDQEEYFVEDEAEKAGEDDIDPDDLEEMELEDEVLATKAGQDMNDELQLFDEDTEIGATANKFMRDPRISKRRALAMAGARALTKRGLYDQVAKASSTISTDSFRPFQQQRAPQRRAEMDRRTVNARNKANAELAAMREGASMGRENEERRRAIDGAVNKLREIDPRMRHADALRRVRREMPGLFR